MSTEQEQRHGASFKAQSAFSYYSIWLQLSVGPYPLIFCSWRVSEISSALTCSGLHCPSHGTPSPLIRKR